MLSGRSSYAARRPARARISDTVTAFASMPRTGATPAASFPGLRRASAQFHGVHLFSFNDFSAVKTQVDALSLHQVEPVRSR